MEAAGLTLSTRAARALQLVAFDHSVLRRAAAPVTEIDGAVRALVQDLTVTMLAHGALGIAAPQVGHARAVCVIAPAASGREEPLVLINPQLVSAEGAQRGLEGCLSLPGIVVEVERAAQVVVEAQTEAGLTHRVVASGIFAACLQHELDHLAGRLILDRLSWSERQDAMTAMRRRQAPGTSVPREGTGVTGASAAV